MRSKVISVVSNNIATDQRLIKVGNSLEKNGFQFNLIGIKHRGTQDLSHISFKTERLTVYFKRNFLFYAEIQLRFFFRLLFINKKNAILLSNDLDTLFPTFLISKIFGIPLVFDSHEIFSELPSLKKGSLQKFVWKQLEKFLIPKLKNFYTVSESYANWFNQSYGKSPKIIKNVPLKSNVKEDVIKNTNPKIIIYQGAVNYSRGIDKMILAMRYLKNIKLWIVGDGPFLEEYKTLTVNEKLKNKVFFHGRVKPTDLKELTQQALIGLSLEQDNGLSYRYALPNKIFDYIHAGIPILGSIDLPEVKSVINNYKIGELIENHNPKHIADKINLMLNKDFSNYIDGLQKAALDLRWENQENDLIEIFKQASNE